MALVHDWVTAGEAWNAFIEEHPELGYSPGVWSLHNFLRRYRNALEGVDVIRQAKGRFWVARMEPFKAAAFECATGRQHLLTPLARAA